MRQPPSCYVWLDELLLELLLLFCAAVEELELDDELDRPSELLELFCAAVLLELEELLELELALLEELEELLTSPGSGSGV